MVDSTVTKKLSAAFPGSFINAALEFIAHKEANSYFRLEDCESEFDVKCKVLEWLSRDAYKTCPFSSDVKNKRLHSFILNGINTFLGTNFTSGDMEIIYQKLGNRVCHLLTEKFVKNEYDISIFDNKPKFYCKTPEEYIERTSRCASCFYGETFEDNYHVLCHCVDKNNYPYAIDNSVDCEQYKEKDGE